MTNRRDFIKTTGLLGLAGLAGSLVGNEKAEELQHVSQLLSGGDVELPPLPYAYDALEPFIDKQTMILHHDKHHQSYIDKLKTAPPTEINLGLSAEENCNLVDAKTSLLIRNNLGGHYNHSFFWPLLRPNSGGKENIPAGKFAEALQQGFNTYDNFKQQFSDRAARIFGSGWCWLIIDEMKMFRIITTPNQDNPLMKVVPERGKPLLALDVWEHAYYLKYQNKRADYITAWWNLVNWDVVGNLYTAAMK